MYQIMLKNKDLYKQYMVKQEITKEVTKEVTDYDGSVSTVTVQEGTGKYKSVAFATDDIDELEAECIELLKSYTTEQVIPYENLTYALDLVWAK